MEPAGPDDRARPPRSRRGLSRGVRVLLGIVLALVVVYLLFVVVFPWFQEYQDDPTLEGAWGLLRTVVA